MTAMIKVTIIKVLSSPFGPAEPGAPDVPGATDVPFRPEGAGAPTDPPEEEDPSNFISVGSQTYLSEEPTPTAPYIWL